MIKILAIETSCDETAAAVVAFGGPEHGAAATVAASDVYSQIAIHAPFGGVVPSVAKFEHEKHLPDMVTAVLAKAGVKPEELSAVAVTSGPGLAPALVVGLNYAKGFAAEHRLRLVGANHIEGHIYSPWLDETTAASIGGQFPLLFLVVSGGHTQLVLMRDWGQYEILGATLDDAAGESFDKVAKMLGLGYPGGPIVSRLAAEGNRAAYDYPRPMMKSGDYSFSFAGLKTSVLYSLKGQNQGRVADVAPDAYDDATKRDVCASFEQAAVDVLVAKTMRAAAEHLPQAVLVVGGVAANKHLFETLRARLPAEMPLFRPSNAWIGDNAAMIALAGFHRFVDGQFAEGSAIVALDIRARWPITSLSSRA